jgi:hypothetical protein
MPIVPIRAGLCVIALALLNPSCRTGQQEPGRLEPHPGWRSPAKPTDEHVQGEPLPGVEVIAVTPHNRALQGHPGRRVVRDSISWREVWEQASSTLEVSPLPTVNFRDEMVLAATSGPFDIDGRFTMDSIIQSGHRVSAVVTRKIGCGPTGTIMGSGPTVFIRVPARPKVRFIERQRMMPGCS